MKQSNRQLTGWGIFAGTVIVTGIAACLSCAASFGPRTESACGLRPVWCGNGACCIEGSECRPDGTCATVRGVGLSRDASAE